MYYLGYITPILILNNINMNLPAEIINKIMSYIQSNTNQIVKNAISKYYDKKYIYEEADNTNWSISRIVNYNKKIITRINFELIRKMTLNRIQQYGNYRSIFSQIDTSNYIINSIKSICDKKECNKYLLKRGILSDYIKQPHRRRRKSKNITFFNKSKADYIKRK
jgi:hypothetical protein